MNGHMSKQVTIHHLSMIWIAILALIFLSTPHLSLVSAETSYSKTEIDALLTQHATKYDLLLKQLSSESNIYSDKNKYELLNALNTEKIVLKEQGTLISSLDKRFEETIKLGQQYVAYWQNFLPAFLTGLAVMISIAGVAFPYFIGSKLRKDYQTALDQAKRASDEAQSMVESIKKYVDETKIDLGEVQSEMMRTQLEINNVQLAVSSVQHNIQETVTSVKASQSDVDQMSEKTKSYMEQVQDILKRILDRSVEADSLVKGIQIQASLTVHGEQRLTALVKETPQKVRQSTEEEARRLGRKLWPNGATLRVRFLDGTPAQQDAVKRVAQEWMKYANLTFAFENAPDAEIRVSFRGDGSWSQAGTDALGVPLSQPTMNFAWGDTETVLREFGYAIGLNLEHQIPNANLEWDKEVVYRDLSGPPNRWSPEQIEKFLQRHDSPTEKEFDPKSIMMNFIPERWTKNHLVVEENTVLSEGDKTFVAKLYPRQ